MAHGDVFVVLPSLTEAGAVILGKNSSRPRGEVQEIIYVKGETTDDQTIKCTYKEIEVEPASKLSVILSKPGWSWGADTGSNEMGVFVTTIWQKGQGGLAESYGPKDYLLPLDLVRLGLEQGNSASSAVEAIGKLVEKYGPSGQGREQALASYLLADAKEVWLLNSFGTSWAAEQITDGFKRFAYGLCSKVDKSTEALGQLFQDWGIWNGEGDISFSSIFAADIDSEPEWPNGGPSSGFCITDMFSVLRDKENGICKDQENNKPTQSSQVSTLTSDRTCCHWFTATPDPSISVYKPFVFTPNVRISPLTISNNESDHMHGLYKLHSTGAGSVSASLLRDLELSCVNEVRAYLDNNPLDAGDCPPGELDDLMKDCVEAEVKFYR